MLVLAYPMDELTVERDLTWDTVEDTWRNGEFKEETVRVEDLNIGDVVSWEIHKGRSSWYRNKDITQFSGTIVSRTKTGYIVIELSDGTKKRFKSGKGKHMKVRREGTYSVMGLLDAEIE
jgi:hypothetical protein